MKKIPLEIIALSHSVTQSHSFAVVLGEVDGTEDVCLLLLVDLKRKLLLLPWIT
jgi:hypothetical protein